MSFNRSSRWSPPDAAHGGEEVASQVRVLLEGIKPERPFLLPALHRIQEELGYVPKEAVPVLASYFNTTPAAIFGVISFYSEIRTEPPPKVEIEWCSGPACLLKGGGKVRTALEAVLGSPMNSALPDGSIGLRLVQCDGTCHLAPLVRIGGRYIGPLGVAEAIELARRLKEGKPP